MICVPAACVKQKRKQLNKSFLALNCSKSYCRKPVGEEKKVSSLKIEFYKCAATSKISQMILHSSYNTGTRMKFSWSTFVTQQTRWPFWLPCGWLWVSGDQGCLLIGVGGSIPGSTSVLGQSTWPQNSLWLLCLCCVWMIQMGRLCHVRRPVSNVRMMKFTLYSLIFFWTLTFWFYENF